MSFNAVKWAIDVRAGGPSAKATLWSIANYADDNWCSYPSQATISSESEQSVDTVQRRIRDLEAAGLIRRIPLRFQGRKSSNFFILRPSRYFDAPIEDIEPLLPRGFVVDRDAAAAPDDTADCGIAEPQTVPQVAADDTANGAALVRQQEPLNLAAAAAVATRARDPVISDLAWKLASDLAVIAGHGHDPPEWPESWCGAPMRLQTWLNEGWTAPLIEIGARKAAARRPPGTIKTVEFFEGAIADEIARQARPLPKGVADVQTAQRSGKSGESLGVRALRMARSTGAT